MSTSDLGKLTRVDPRTVWSHEAVDFTPWLVDHIDSLGEVLGLELEVTGREQGVGDFSVDIHARDLGRDKVVVIENQLEQTDHSHLGQLITYAAGLEASVIVWLSREFREEHRQALDWLNRGEGTSTEYFGVVVEILQIDDSKPAVHFRVVASPNKWSRDSQRAQSADAPSGKWALYKQFFQRLIDELREKYKFTNARAGQPQNWYTFSTGISGFQYSVSFAARHRVRTEVYIDLGDRDENVAAFEALRKDKSGIEIAFEEPLEWELLEARRACRVAVYRPGSIEDSAESLEEYHCWAIERLVRFKKVIGPRLAAIVTRASEGQVLA